MEGTGLSIHTNVLTTKTEINFPFFLDDYLLCAYLRERFEQGCLLQDASCWLEHTGLGYVDSNPPVVQRELNPGLLPKVAQWLAIQ